MKIKCIFILHLFGCIQYCLTQYAAVTRRQPKTHCENPTKNSLVENFFNIIFSEFYTTPPVCVCVQMCSGQSTYCYPNGCLKTATAANNHVSKTVDTSPAELQINKNQFMLLKDEKYDFMTDFLKRNYVDDSKIEPQKINQRIQDIRPDPFKDKYSMLGKYKRIPNVELRYNINEKVKNAKLDLNKVEGVDLTKTRWPLNRSNRASVHKLFSDVEKPLISNSKFFKAMLPDDEIAEYPPKYFKRDLTKTKDSDDINIKSFYLLENSLNTIDNKSFSLETLIDTLIRNSFGTEADATTNFGISSINETEIKLKDTMEKDVNVNSTSLTNGSTSVISMNLTNENIEKNMYADDNSKTNNTANINEMIIYLAKQIEIKNNTSMEIAKNIAGGLNGTNLTTSFRENAITESGHTTPDDEKSDNTLLFTDDAVEFTTSNVELITLRNDFTTFHTEYSTSQVETTTTPEIKATKKNRQRVARKFNSNKINHVI